MINYPSKLNYFDYQSINDQTISFNSKIKTFKSVSWVVLKIYFLLFQLSNLFEYYGNSSKSCREILNKGYLNLYTTIRSRFFWWTYKIIITRTYCWLLRNNHLQKRNRDTSSSLKRDQFNSNRKSSPQFKSQKIL